MITKRKVCTDSFVRLKIGGILNIVDKYMAKIKIIKCKLTIMKYKSKIVS